MSINDFNICTASDSYKYAHWAQYPKGTEKVYSYFESRNGATYDQTMFFGLQYLLKKFFVGEVVTRQKIDAAQCRVDAHLAPGAFNICGWNYILEKCGGRLPVTIKAVPEGLPVDTNNVLLTIENNVPEAYWLTNYLETILTHVWAPSTVATMSYNAKRMMMKFLKRTSDDQEAINFMLHDFSFRGVSSFQSAYIESAGHLINFMGTDTFPAVECAMDYYNAPEVVAYSVPATEHSLMTARGKAGEMQILGELLDKYPTGILSVVIDSYDYLAFIANAVKNFKDKILSRDGKLVFRPDSGAPNQVTMEVIDALAAGFGHTTNSKDYKVLNPKVGVLWGDGIDIQGIAGILFTMEVQGWASENIVFGMGGGLCQKINRDIQRFAFKSSYQERDGVGYDIFKNPIDKSKRSKKGRLKLIRDTSGRFSTVRENEDGEDILEPVFKNGELVREMTFEQVRKNAKL